MTAPAVIRFRLSDHPRAGGIVIDPAGDADALVVDLQSRYRHRLGPLEIRERFEERAAIHEFEARMPRHQAEALALQQIIKTEHDRTATANPSDLLEKPKMSLTVSESAGGNFLPCPPGTFIARCSRIIDLGTQQTEWQGEKKQAPKVLITFEILDEDTRREDGGAFTISKRYTASLHEKAGLRKDLASWRGRDFTPEELKGFSLANVLGKPCMVSVVHVTKEGKTFANLASIMKPPKGMPIPAGLESLLSWDMSKPDWQAFAALPPKLVQQIEASPEWAAIKGQLPASVSLSGKAEGGSTTGGSFDDLGDDVPF